MPSGPSRAPVVLSIGGSVLIRGEGDGPYLDKLAGILRRLGRSMPLVVTTGGGRTAREYIRLGRSLGLTEFELDEVGIDVTRLHARLLAGRIGPPTPSRIPTSVSEAVHELHRASPIILGGTEPGHTTDGVAALLAVRLRAARVVNATDVAGVFDRDPRRAPTAKRFDRLTWKEFARLIHAGATGEAGQQFLFDRLGADALLRAKIPLRVVHGRDLENLERAVRGRSFVGTAVEPT